MKKNKDKILTQAMFYILLSLKKERHGYEIMTYVEELTEGRVKIGPGTLYNLLAKFTEDGTIRMVSETDNKKVYLLTLKGEHLLKDEVDRLKSMLKDVEKAEGKDEL